MLFTALVLDLCPPAHLGMTTTCHEKYMAEQTEAHCQALPHEVCGAAARRTGGLEGTRC